MSSVQIDPRVDHYKVLGVKPEDDDATIKKAYRRLAKKYHPDSTGGDKAKETRFKEISQAYDVLGDKAKRTQYDAMRSGGGGAFNGFQGFPGGFEGAGPDINLNEMFSQIFQGGARRGNVHVRFGGNGSPFGGASPFSGGPGGRPRRRQRPAAPKEPTERQIRLADGTTAVQRGDHIHSDLRLTLDQAILGTVAEVETLDGKSKVKVPPGTSSGVKLRLKNKGSTAANGRRGHHYVTVQIDVPKAVDENAKQLLIQFMQRTKR